MQPITVLGIQLQWAICNTRSQRYGTNWFVFRMEFAGWDLALWTHMGVLVDDVYGNSTILNIWLSWWWWVGSCWVSPRRWWSINGRRRMFSWESTCVWGYMCWSGAYVCRRAAVRDCVKTRGVLASQNTGAGRDFIWRLRRRVSTDKDTGTVNWSSQDLDRRQE